LNFSLLAYSFKKKVGEWRHSTSCPVLSSPLEEEERKQETNVVGCGDAPNIKIKVFFKKKKQKARKGILLYRLLEQFKESKRRKKYSFGSFAHKIFIY